MAMHAEAVGSDREPVPPGQLTFQASTWYLLAMAGAQARQLWSGTLTQVHLSPSQFKVLRALSESGPLCQHQLADLIAVDPRNAVPVIDGLADRGLVARAVHPADRRRRVLTLTPAGQKLATDLASVGSELEDEFLSPLTAAEQDSLRTMLLALLRA
jgi:DNA-binding MarR family transcriptional regulator